MVRAAGRRATARLLAGERVPSPESRGAVLGPQRPLGEGVRGDGTRPLGVEERARPGPSAAGAQRGPDLRRRARAGAVSGPQPCDLRTGRRARPAWELSGWSWFPSVTPLISGDLL